MIINTELKTEKSHTYQYVVKWGAEMELLLTLFQHCMLTRCTDAVIGGPMKCSICSIELVILQYSYCLWTLYS